MKLRQKDIKKTGGKTKPIKKAGKNVRPESGSKQSKQKSSSGFSLFRLFTGLTFQEWKRHRQLKQQLSGKGPGSDIPDTAQKTITFEKIFQDGICKVREGFYTKMVEFDDLNYCLQDVEDQAEILGLYSQLINYFEPGIHFQVFLFKSYGQHPP